MQYLIQTQDGPGVNWQKHNDLLSEESLCLHELWKKGIVRQMWLTEQNQSVLLFECGNRIEVQSIMESLPLVKQRLITYVITKLVMYSPFDRIIATPVSASKA